MPKPYRCYKVRKQRAFALLVVISILAIAGALLFLWADYIKRLSKHKEELRYQVEVEQVLSFATQQAIMQLESTVQQDAYWVTAELDITQIQSHSGTISLITEVDSETDTLQLLVSKGKSIPAIKIDYGTQDYTLYFAWETKEQNYSIGQNLQLEESAETYSSSNSDTFKNIPLPRSTLSPTMTLGTPRSNIEGVTMQPIQDEIPANWKSHAGQTDPFLVLSERTLYNVPMLRQIPESAQNAIEPEKLQTGAVFAINPIPVDLKLTGRFFHTRHDDLHRFRFYADSIWWNPYPLSIDFGSEKRAYIIVWDMLPEWEIENEDTEEVLSFNLSELPVSGTDNSVNEITPHAWMTFKSAYTREGEIYAVEEPLNQSEGLARTLSTSAWIYSPSGRKPLGIWGGNWLAPAHRIHITPQTTPKARIRIYPFTEAMQDEQTIESYGNPILEIRNIPFDYPSIELTGSTYSREKSTDFTRNDCLIQWQVHLKDSSEDLVTLLKTWDPRTPVWDFDNPLVSDLFEIQFRILDGETEAISQNKFSDSTVNSHSNSTNTYRIFDVLTEKPKSIGSFRSLNFTEYPPLTLGENGGNNRLFEQLSTISTTETGYHACLNVNTMSVDAWATLLQRSYTRFPSCSQIYYNLPTVELSESQAQSLAESIHALIQKNEPFESMRAFYDADIFNKALLSTGIILKTEEITLRGSDMAATLAPLLSVRSDSFCTQLALELYRGDKLIARKNSEILLQIIYGSDDNPTVKIMSMRPVGYDELH